MPKRLRLAMEMEEDRKVRLENMVTTTQIRFRLALETEEERRAKKKRMDLIYIRFQKHIILRSEFAHPVMGTIFLVYIYVGQSISMSVVSKMCSGITWHMRML